MFLIFIIYQTRIWFNCECLLKRKHIKIYLTSRNLCYCQLTHTFFWYQKWNALLHGVSVTNLLANKIFVEFSEEAFTQILKSKFWVVLWWIYCIKGKLHDMNIKLISSNDSLNNYTFFRLSIFKLKTKV